MSRPQRPCEQCLVALAQVIEILEEVAAGNPRDWDPEIQLAFHRIRDAARDPHAQSRHGSNLVRGWMQLKFGSGYARNGSPEFAPPVAGQSLEA